MAGMRVFLATAALLAAAPALGAQAYAVSVEELARSSAAVLRGRVGNARTLRSEDGLRLFTSYAVRTSAVWRGQASSVARVVIPGGVDGRIGQRVDAAPALARGEDVILFLQRSGSDSFVVTGLAQGKFAVVAAAARPDLSQLSFVRTGVRAGERRAEEMPVAELERRVRSTR
jgi:hypothetical protein